MNEKLVRWCLAGLASVGVVSTGLLVRKETIDVVKKGVVGKWKKELPHYIPAISVGLLTIGCIVGANVLGDVANATLSSLLLAADEVYFKDRKRSEEAMESVAQEHESAMQVISKDIRSKCTIPKIRRQELLWHDGFRGVDGYFGATDLNMWIALYFLNRELAIKHEVSLAYFYEQLGLSVPEGADEVGWSLGAGVVYGYEHIDVTWERVPYDDGLVCRFITFPYPPTHDYLWYTPDEAKYQGWE